LLWGKRLTDSLWRRKSGRAALAAWALAVVVGAVVGRVVLHRTERLKENWAITNEPGGPSAGVPIVLPRFPKYAKSNFCPRAGLIHCRERN
jgi:hypothetical protein